MDNDIEVIVPQQGPQWAMCATRADIAIGGGAFFGGKSYSLIMEAARNVDHPSYRGNIFRRTYPQITDSGGLSDIASKMYLGMGAVPTDSRCVWTFPSGAMIRFCHLQRMEDYRSSQFCFLGIDQLEEFTENEFFYLRARNRPSPGYDRKCYCRCTCNPQPGWLADLIQWWWNPDTGLPIRERSGIIKYFIRKNDRIIWVEKEYSEVLDTTVIRPISFTFIPSTSSDNPMGLANDPNYQSNIATMDRVSVERFLLGNWKVDYSGGMFNVSWFHKIKKAELPKGIRLLRYWDFAASEVKDGKEPDYTVGALCGIYGGDFYIIDICRFRENPGVAVKRMQQCAELDGKAVSIRWEEEKASAGRYNSFHLSGIFIGYVARSDRISGDKIERAKPLSSLAYSGRVYIVEGEWNGDFLEEVALFPKGKKDQVDAVDGALKCLTQDRAVFSFSITYCKNFKIDSTRNDYSSTYIAYYLNRNSVLYALMGKWNSIESKLFLYWARQYDTILPHLIVNDAIQFGIKSIVNLQVLGNDLLVSSDETRTVGRILTAKFGEYEIPWNARMPIQYDLYGSIAYIDALFRGKMITVHNKLEEPAAQFAGWTYAGDKVMEGYEYCHCLCLIGSAIHTTLVRQSVKPRFPDYSSVKSKEERKGNLWQTV